MDTLQSCGDLALSCRISTFSCIHIKFNAPLNTDTWFSMFSFLFSCLAPCFAWHCPTSYNVFPSKSRCLFFIHESSRNIQLTTTAAFIYCVITKNAPYAWGNFHACAITRCQKPQQLGRARIACSSIITCAASRALSASAVASCG